MTNERNNFVFSKRDVKISSQLGHDTKLSTHQCATARCSRCTSEMMPRCRRADVLEPDAGASTRTWYRTAGVSMRHSLPKPLCPWSQLLRSYMYASAWELPPHPTISAMDAGASLRSPLCPTLEATTTTMLTQTALSSSARVATCGGEAMSTTTLTTATMVIHSSTEWKRLGIPNLFMFHVGTYWSRGRGLENKRLPKEKNTTDLRALQAHQDVGGTSCTFQELADRVRRIYEEYAGRLTTRYIQRWRKYMGFKNL